jgi:hypothetical protein
MKVSVQAKNILDLCSNTTDYCPHVNPFNVTPNEVRRLDGV